MKIKVFPTKASALRLKHPIDGLMKSGGSDWEKDGFTSRRLTDGSVTEDAAKAYSGAPNPLPKRDISQSPPARQTRPRRR